MVELYPHQADAIDQMHNGCILWGGVGSGKTMTSLGYYWTKVLGGKVGDLGSIDPANYCDVLVVTTAKKRDSGDWLADAARFGLSDSRDPDLPEFPIVSVDSWNNIKKYEDFSGFVIFDEQRLVGSGAWVKSFYRIAKNNSWILLSATPGDVWLDYIPVFVANGFYKNRTEFKQDHVIYAAHSKFPKVVRYVGLKKLRKFRDQVLVEMPFERHTTQWWETIEVDYDKELMDRVVKARWHVYEARPLKDAGELFRVMRKVVNSDSSRLTALTELLRRHPRVIVFYNFDYELESLRSLGQDLSQPRNDSGDEVVDLESDLVDWESLKEPIWKESRFSPSPSMQRSSSSSNSSVMKDELETFWRSAQPEMVATPTSFAVAEWNGHKHEPIPKTDSWLYFVQYAAGAEGWNCIETDATVFFSQTYSYKLHHQGAGRIDRLNTPYTDLYYYRLVSDSTIDKLISQSLGSKQNFNEAAALKSFAK